jgi:hypothetical protein
MSASLPCNVISHEGSETGSESGVGAETSLKVGSGQDPKKIIPDPQPCLEDYHSGSDSAKVGMEFRSEVKSGSAILVKKGHTKTLNGRHPVLVENLQTVRYAKVLCCRSGIQVLHMKCGLKKIILENTLDQCYGSVTFWYESGSADPYL